MAKKEKALALRGAGADLSMTSKLFNASIMEFATLFSGRIEVAPAKLAEAYDRLDQAKKVVEDTVEVAKAYMKNLVKTSGERVVDTKGSYEAHLGSYLYSIRPTRTGTDPKKLEALLRAKEVEDMQEYMDATITYKVNEQKLGKALAEKVLTKAELENCAYDESYALQPPKKVEE